MAEDGPDEQPPAAPSMRRQERLALQAKEAQRIGRRARTLWHSYCDDEGNGTRDPHRHPSAFLLGFLALLAPTSPHRDTDWVSRQLTGFGLSKNRPPGLVVDDNGSFSFPNLMAAWGTSSGLSGELIMAAAQAHLYTNSKGAAGVTLRFGVDRDAAGTTRIRVFA